VQFFPQVLGDIISDYCAPGVVGTYVSSFGKLNRPNGVTVDPSNNVYIADTGSHIVTVWTTQGDPLHTIGNGELSYPSGVFYDKYELFITEEGNDRISIHSQRRYFVFGQFGFGDGQFDGPSGVFVQDDLIYVTDTGNHRIQIFEVDGKFLRKFGEEGEKPGQFKQPLGLVISDKKELYVVNYGNNRIDVFSLDGKFLRNFGSVGSGAGQLDQPFYIIIHGEEVLVTEERNHRVSAFNQKGEFLRSFGSPYSSQGSFCSPRGLAYAAGKLFVVQWGTNIVHILE